MSPIERRVRIALHNVRVKSWLTGLPVPLLPEVVEGITRQILPFLAGEMHRARDEEGYIEREFSDAGISGLGPRDTEGDSEEEVEEGAARSGVSESLSGEG